MADKYTEDPQRSGAQGGAQIYHERKGPPVWLWPLLALLLLGLLFAFFHHKNTDQNASAGQAPIAPAPVTTPAPMTTPATGTATTPALATAGEDIKIHSGTDIATAKPDQASLPGVPLSNVILFAAAADPATFIGRRAKLTNVTVQKVISDRAFFVGPVPQQQVLVLLDRGMNAGASGSAKVTVASGKLMSLVGVMEPMPTQEAINQTYGVIGADYTAVRSQKVYLHATVAQQK